MWFTLRTWAGRAHRAGLAWLKLQGEEFEPCKIRNPITCRVKKPESQRLVPLWWQVWLHAVTWKGTWRARWSSREWCWGCCTPRTIVNLGGKCPAAPMCCPPNYQRHQKQEEKKKKKSTSKETPWFFWYKLVKKKRFSMTFHWHWNPWP